MTSKHSGVARDQLRAFVERSACHGQPEDHAGVTDLVSEMADTSIRVERLTASVNELNRQTETSMKQVVIILETFRKQVLIISTAIILVALAVIIGGS